MLLLLLLPAHLVSKRECISLKLQLAHCHHLNTVACGGLQWQKHTDIAELSGLYYI